MSITSDTVPDNGTGFSATNLINNLGTRVANSIWEPMIDINQNKDSSIKSCFITDQSDWSDPNTFVLGVDLGDSFFVHAILLVSDLLRSSNTPFTIADADLSYADTKHRFQRFEVYIGDSADYRLNEKVEGGPWLYDPADTNDPDYTTFTSEKGGTNADMWAWGKELWANKQGRYIHFVADYSHLTGATVSICNLGIMGTKYVRDTPLPEEVTLDKGKTTTFSVVDIYAEIPIANTLIPAVR